MEAGFPMETGTENEGLSPPGLPVDHCYCKVSMGLNSETICPKAKFFVSYKVQTGGYGDRKPASAIFRV